MTIKAQTEAVSAGGESSARAARAAWLRDARVRLHQPAEDAAAGVTEDEAHQIVGEGPVTLSQTKGKR
jgi:hypothetical protein